MFLTICISYQSKAQCQRLLTALSQRGRCLCLVALNYHELRFKIQAVSLKLLWTFKKWFIFTAFLHNVAQSPSTMSGLKYHHTKSQNTHFAGCLGPISFFLLRYGGHSTMTLLGLGKFVCISLIPNSAVI